LNRNLTIFIFLIGLTFKYFLYANDLTEIFLNPPPFENLKIEKEIEYYDSSNLWEYINGAAPGYISYGFKKLATFIVLTKDEQFEFGIDVYDMSDSLNAFGIFSIETPNEERNKKIGSSSYFTPTMIYFWQDCFYIKIMSYDETGQSQKIAQQIAETISEIIPSGGKQPKIFNLFPKENLIKNSERYTVRDVLGQSYFLNGFSASYANGETNYEIYILPSANKKITRENLIKYKNYIKDSGEIIETGLIKNFDSFYAKHNYYNFILGLDFKNQIILLLGNIPKHQAIDIVDEIIQKMD
jgi:hypothetical protein